MLCLVTFLNFLYSSGVGRSGTFICFDIILDKIKKDKVVDIFGTINQLRSQHMKLVKDLVRSMRTIFTFAE